MDKFSNAISRPARVKFKNNTEVIGTLFYADLADGIGEGPYPYFVIKLNDAKKTEKFFDYWNVDIITFL